MASDIIEARLAEASHRLSLWLVEKAITGLPPLASAHALAESYRSDPGFPHAEARVAAMVRWEAGKSFTAGFLTSLGGMLALPVALPSQLGATWLLQARMAATLADLRGHEVTEPWVQSLVLLSLMGGAAPEILRGVGVRSGQWATRQLVTRLSEATLQQINRRVGFRLLETASRRGLLRVSRLVPLVGAAMGGAIDAYGCRRVARTARRLFAPRLLLTAG